MRLKRLSYWHVPVVAAVLACSALTPGSGTTPPPAAFTRPSSAAATATPAATGRPSPTLEPVKPLTGLTANLYGRIDSGEWSLEEGLVTSMKFLVGEATALDVNPAGRPIKDLEGTGLMLAAALYLKNGPDAATRAELLRLRDLILPDMAKLEPYATPAPLTGLLRAPAAKFNRQTVDCSTLWLDGFPAGTTTTCFQYRTLTLAGHGYRVYVPTDWLATDVRQAAVDDILAAVQQAVGAYRAYGEVPPADFVFSLLPYIGLSSADADSVLMATDYDSGADHCRIAVFPLSVDGRLNGLEFQQSVAHELFHCYQARNFPGQYLDPFPSNNWWVEGTAEYFSNVAYPTVNLEHRWIPDFDDQSVSTSLVRMDYPTFIFWQFLADESGPEAVLHLISTLPTQGGSNEQLQALAGYPGIDELFHKFAEEYIDARIMDASGAAIPVTPGQGQIEEFTASRTATIPARPFVLTRARLRFPEDTHPTLAEEGTDELRTSAESVFTSGSWRPLPSDLTAGCGDQEYVYIATATAAADTVYEPRVRAAVEDSRDGCDPCLIGEWQVDVNSQAQASLAVTNIQGLRLQGVEGTVTARITDAGYMSLNFQGYVVRFSLDRGDTQADATLTMNGLWESDWYSEGSGSGTLFIPNPFSAPASATHYVFTLPDGSFTQDKTNEFAFLNSGGALYQCQGDTLLVDPFTPSLGRGQSVPWLRAASSP